MREPGAKSNTGGVPRTVSDRVHLNESMVQQPRKVTKAEIRSMVGRTGEDVYLEAGNEMIRVFRRDGRLFATGMWTNFRNYDFDEVYDSIIDYGFDVTYSPSRQEAIKRRMYGDRNPQ